MSDKITFKAEPREGQGSGPAGRLRHEGKVPAVIYAEGKEARPLQMEAHDFAMLLRHHTGESLLLDLHVKGQKPCMALLREVQHHPVSGKVIHVDMLEVSAKRKLRVPIEIELVGVPYGVSQEGGVMEHLLHSVEVECLPADLMEKIELDVTKLSTGDRLMVSDIELDTKKYTLLTAGDVAIVTVASPRVAEEEEEEVTALGVGGIADAAGGQEDAKTSEEG